MGDIYSEKELAEMETGTMAEKTSKLKDKYVKDTLANYPKAAFTWYLMAGYAKFGKQRPIISDHLYNRLEAAVQAGWDNIGRSGWKISDNFEDHRMNYDFHFNKLNKHIKTTALQHIKEVYHTGGDMDVEIPEEPNAGGDVAITSPAIALPPPAKEEPKKETKLARIILEARIYVSPIESKKDELEVKKLIERYEFTPLFANPPDYRVLCSSSRNKALILARTYSLINKLKELGVSVNEYRVSEVIVDSTVKDVWSVRKTA